MVNNIGKTINKTLNTTLGGVTTPALVATDIDMKTGELGNGCLIFDSAGTIGVITDYIDTSNFTVTTYAISIDIETLLTSTY